ncbi:MAG: class I SAM-dependent methyltransferase [Rhodospirillales bacterium]
MGVEFVVLVFSLLITGLIAVYAFRVGITPMPTGVRVRAVMLELMQPNGPGTIYELGSGWGTLTVPIAEQFPDCRVVGYELSPLPWMVSRLLKAVAGAANLSFRREDFFKADLSDASLIVCYLNGRTMAKLKSKLEAELEPGTLIVSHFFAFREWVPVEKRTVGYLFRSPVYVYRIEAADSVSEKVN